MDYRRLMHCCSLLLLAGYFQSSFAEAQSCLTEDENPYRDWHFPPQTLDERPPLSGTVSGYDVGGSQPVCWSSVFCDPRLQNDNIIQGADPDTFNLVLLNQLVQDEEQNVTSFTLLDHCATGTSFTIMTPRLGWGDMIWHGKETTFEVKLEVDLASFGDSVVPNDDDGIDDDEIMVWYRIFKCAAQEVGFCQPFLDASRWANYYPDPYNVPEGEFEYQDGDTLTTVPTNPLGNLTYTTKWISKRLVAENTSSAAAPSLFTNHVNMTTTVPSGGGKGAFHIIAHATVQLNSAQSNRTYRMDFSNILPGGPVGINQFPHIGYLTHGMKIFIGVLIGVCGAITLVQFVFLIYHRSHRVMTMSQGGLLAWLAASSCITITFSFLLLPIQDIFCRLCPLLMIPGTLMPSILVGRLWRVYSTLNGAYQLGKTVPGSGLHNRSSNSNSASIKEGRKSSINTAVGRERLTKYSRNAHEGVIKILNFLAFSWMSPQQDSRGRYRKRTTTAFRRATTTRETVVLILVLALPQTVVQVFGAIYYESYLYLNLNFEEDKGRYTCFNSNHQWVYFAGAAYMAFLFLLAMYVAWCSRHLPSAFNEKNEVFKTGFVNGITTCVITGGIALSDAPETSPNVTTTLAVVLTITISMVTTWTVVMPKIRRVLSGEKVVWTNVLREINQVSMSSSDGELPRNVSQIAIPSSYISNATGNAEIVSGTSPKAEGRDRSYIRKRILLQSDEGLPKSVERCLYEIKDLATSATDRCAEGRPLDQCEWEALVKKTAALASEFELISMHFEAGNKTAGEGSNT